MHLIRSASRQAALTALVLAGCGLMGGPAFAQRPRIEKARVELFADRDGYAAGSTARFVARVEIDEGWHVQSHTPSYDYLIPTELELGTPEGWTAAEPEYPAHLFWTAEFEEEPLAVYEGTVSIFADVRLPADAAATTITAELRYQACDDRQCLPPTTAKATLDLAVGTEGAAINQAYFAVEPERTTPAAPALGLATVLGLGLVGGLILNVMPCVLPVLSLKLLGLMQQAGEGRRAVVAGSLATTAGILVSFWGLAGLAIAARAAGDFIGWGVQFQNPTFVTFLTLVVVLFCLNLWGLFEVPLPGMLARAGGVGGGKGVAGHFATGLFATLMATPCSAPFLGTAVGFGLSQSGGIIFATFTAIGLGLALPYLLLAAVPRSVAWLPKPGPWMIQLKVIMGFLLAGAAVWLLFVLQAQVSPGRLAFIEGGLLAIALFIWLAHTAQRTGGRRLAQLSTVAAIAGTLFLSASAPPASAVAREAAGIIAWTDFDRARAQALSDEGTMVFIDVTADWCFTCKANERLVLETEQIAAAFEEHAVVPMRADWTNRNEEIGQLLAEYGRYSIPFYLLYRPGDEPFLFPELLTKSAVLEALAGSTTQTASVER